MASGEEGKPDLQHQQYGKRPQFDSVFKASTTTASSIFSTSLLLQGNHNILDNDGCAFGEIESHRHFTSPYVKVNMDGYPIGRKIHLTSFKSYETLALKLEIMFFNSQPPTSLFMGSDQEQNMTTETRQAAPKLFMGSSEFMLTFEDREGDCMPVGDVPWRMFCHSVERLRIMRTSGANNSALWFHCQDIKTYIGLSNSFQ